MGLLAEGHPLTWAEIAARRDVVHAEGLRQLMVIVEKCQDRQKDSFLWGDEVELTLVRFDHANKRVRLLLKGHELLPHLVQSNDQISENEYKIAWHPEATDYMIEGVPSMPYGFLPSYLNIVEANIRLRRQQAQDLLNENADSDYVLSLCAFPRLGEDDYMFPSLERDASGSLCYPEKLISPLHPRMSSVLKNICERRQMNPSINIPIYRDEFTKIPLEDKLFGKEFDYIHLDSPIGGLGCCCLQVTFQCPSFNEAISFYDQLLPLTGILLCLSGACPIWRGYLADVDCRWSVLSQAADDRTADEQKKEFSRSRYNSAPMYLSDENDHLNDVTVLIKEDVVSKLVAQGMSRGLARHFGHLFTHDPLIVLEEQLSSKDQLSTYHFDNLNTVVWHSLRFKPPPLDDEQIGWRVEFRPMDIQLTDFENAALAVFLALLTRAILTYRLDLTIPLSKINENMEKAERRDAVRQEKFHFRVANEIHLMSMNEIINGREDFIGLVPLVEKYLGEREEIDADTKVSVQKYLALISKRASGVLLTDSSWIRQFVLSHPDYRKDSRVSDQIQYDLLWKITQIVNGNEQAPSLLQPTMQTNTKLHPNQKVD